MNTEQPGFSARGVIEGFYGRPFTHAERLDLLTFLGRRGFDCYVYAPKNDPLHRERWREPYPEADLARFRELASTADRVGVRFFYAIAPGLTYDARDPKEFDLLAAKITALVSAGARGVALLFDDLTPDSTTLEPRVQADLVARTAELVARLDPGLAFWFIGNFYCGDVAELRGGRGFWAALYERRATDYFDAYADAVPETVPIMWTGPAVFSARITAADAAAFRDLARRPVVLWDNFPVNDALPGQLFLGPYVGRDPATVSALHGIVVNLMGQAAANRVPLATVGDFLADPARYDPAASLERAVLAATPDAAAAAALRRFVDNHCGHPVLDAAGPAPDLGRLVAAAFGPRPERAARDELRSYLLALAENEDELRTALEGAPLLAEIAPWSAQLTRLARAALYGLEAVGDPGRRDKFAAAVEVARRYDEIVAATVLPSPLEPLSHGHGAGVDRFAELFAAIATQLGERD